MKKIIVAGTGGHAGVVIDIIHQMGGFEIIGVTSVSLTHGESFLGYPVLGDDSVLKEFSPSDIQVAIGVGGFRDNNLRRKVYLRIKEMGFNTINIIHPSAIISKMAILGEAVMLFAGTIINNGVRIGNNTIIATGSTIDHDTVLGNDVLISAGVTIGASVNIGDGTLMALSSNVISAVSIGANSLIAAGAVVINNLPDNSKVFGLPAKPKEVKV